MNQLFDPAILVETTGKEICKISASAPEILPG
jgi:hypothetical protein